MTTIVQFGDVMLYLGDCLEILPRIGTVGAVVTDPPYGMNYRSGHSTDDLWVAGDSISGDQDTSLRDAVAEWSAGCPCLMFGTWKIAKPQKTRQCLIWNPGGALGMGALDLPWKPDHQEIYVLGTGFLGARDSGSVLSHAPVQSMAKNGRLHPTEKPLSLMLDLCRKCPGPILDPFMGSGTTGVACIKLGRRFIGIEKEEKYFDIACRRIEAAHKQPRLFREPIAAPTQEKMI